MDPTITIGANLALLADLLAEASQQANEAASAASDGNRNLAIGTLAGLEAPSPSGLLPVSWTRS